ncbi:MULTISPECIES: Crp/Fnr family transcriptional regulator [Legionella]|uniref:Cyclic nucleotide-binding domain-containing protein n=1 Tax=Legionella septentrionalis TaxID=2498109 RepID=A0A3S0WZ38_9GAMM|nr:MULTISPECIES: cyclic nucleotide-binding domain-containing protein [Legionella]MCP0914026.1 cyclic nucleotide-binding domain-containing protein [Legionella sp. 27cVA30]RUQ81501.1 cyclic nucleotide-binding domain-containing protein [Legionella septentrionalis]RUQ94599.1 cyclic nucleotide-binding domain-containing protein [Legionella septentrionalis]RUR08666.1 cyclic nucleotide-binding domain-containing protein [Legionella septentrionalis]RUR13040.1 cyclic nucleotide-binding domain-containing 
MRGREMTAQIDDLKKTILGHYLDVHELEMLLMHCRTITFLPNQVIYQQGKRIDGVYVILAGEVQLIARTMGEGIVNIEDLNSGDFLGELAFIEKGPCSTSARAIGRVTCLLITHTYFELLTAYFPETKYKILRAIGTQVCGRLKQMHDKVTTLIAHSDMVTLSFFGRVLSSLTQPTHLPAVINGEDIQELGKSPLFQAFTKEEMQELLLEYTQPLEAPKNCILIHENEKNPSCYIIIHGAVQSSIMYANKIAKLSVIGPGALFASVACLDHKSTFTITFITCESALLLKISQENLEFLRKNKPELWYKIFNLICGSLVALGRSINKLDVRLHIEAYNR